MEEFIKCAHNDRLTYLGICIRCGAPYKYCSNCRTKRSICQDCQIKTLKKRAATRRERHASQMKELDGRFRILDEQPPLDDETIQLLDREWEEGQARAE